MSQQSSSQVVAPRCVLEETATEPIEVPVSFSTITNNFIQSIKELKSICQFQPKNIKDIVEIAEANFNLAFQGETTNKELLKETLQFLNKSEYKKSNIKKEHHKPGDFDKWNFYIRALQKEVEISYCLEEWNLSLICVQNETEIDKKALEAAKKGHTTKIQSKILEILNEWKKLQSASLKKENEISKQTKKAPENRNERYFNDRIASCTRLLYKKSHDEKDTHSFFKKDEKEFDKSKKTIAEYQNEIVREVESILTVVANKKMNLAIIRAKKLCEDRDGIGVPLVKMLEAEKQRLENLEHESKVSNGKSKSSSKNAKKKQKQKAKKISAQTHLSSAANKPATPETLPENPNETESELNSEHSESSDTATSVSASPVESDHHDEDSEISEEDDEQEEQQQAEKPKEPMKISQKKPESSAGSSAVDLTGFVPVQRHRRGKQQDQKTQPKITVSVASPSLNEVGAGIGNKGKSSSYALIAAQSSNKTTTVLNSPLSTGKLDGKGMLSSSAQKSAVPISQEQPVKDTAAKNKPVAVQSAVKENKSLTSATQNSVTPILPEQPLKDTAKRIPVAVQPVVKENSAMQSNTLQSPQEHTASNSTNKNSPTAAQPMVKVNTQLASARQNTVLPTKQQTFITTRITPANNKIVPAQIGIARSLGLSIPVENKKDTNKPSVATAATPSALNSASLSQPNSTLASLSFNRSACPKQLEGKPIVSAVRNNEKKKETKSDYEQSKKELTNNPLSVFTLISAASAAKDVALNGEMKIFIREDVVPKIHKLLIESKYHHPEIREHIFKLLVEEPNIAVKNLDQLIELGLFGILFPECATLLNDQNLTKIKEVIVNTAPITGSNHDLRFTIRVLPLISLVCAAYLKQGMSGAQSIEQVCLSNMAGLLNYRGIIYHQIYSEVLNLAVDLLNKNMLSNSSSSLNSQNQTYGKFFPNTPISAPDNDPVPVQSYTSVNVLNLVQQQQPQNTYGAILIMK